MPDHEWDKNGNGKENQKEKGPPNPIEEVKRQAEKNQVAINSLLAQCKEKREAKHK